MAEKCRGVLRCVLRRLAKATTPRNNCAEKNIKHLARELICMSGLDHGAIHVELAKPNAPDESQLNIWFEFFC